MFDEDGRKIDLGLHIGMKLDGMSVTELDHYIDQLNAEISRVKQEKDKLISHNAAAEALFK